MKTADFSHVSFRFHTAADLGNFRDADNTDRIAELTLKHRKNCKMELTEYHKVDTEHAEHS